MERLWLEGEERSSSKSAMPQWHSKPRPKAHILLLRPTARGVRYLFICYFSPY